MASSKTADRTAAKPARKTAAPAKRGIEAASITLSSKNYSSWSMRGWLMVKLAGLDVEEIMIAADDADARKEILLLSPSILVPCLRHEGHTVWDTLDIGEYLNEVLPSAGLLPADSAARAHCRSICGEMHSGFASLRSALPMNLKADFPNFKVWARAEGDIERIAEIWRDCIGRHGGPYLFGRQPCMADAMYAPVVMRFKTYHVALDAVGGAYCQAIQALPAVKQWVGAALHEAEDIEELDMEF